MITDDLPGLLRSAVMRDIRRLTLNFRNNQYESYAEYDIGDIRRGFTAKGTDAFAVLCEVLLPGYTPETAADRDSLKALGMALDDLRLALRGLQWVS